MRLLVPLFTSCFVVFMTSCRTLSLAAERKQLDFFYVETLAQQLAEKRYDPDTGQIPERLRTLTYDEVRSIRFDSTKALWVEDDLDFRVEFFHPGGLHDRSVQINEFTQTHVQKVRFSSEFFDYGDQKERVGRLRSGLGYAGFRVRYPINRDDVFDEFLVFLGSSYFRAVGRDQIYGISARGLAIDTGLASPEEFPRFREFWIGKPQPGDQSLTVYALLDSERVTGAYQFEIFPGEATQIDVKASIFARDSVSRLGIAPFSSMFYFGENTLRKPADYRPEVHDSDGLLIDEWGDAPIWRPLENPQSTRHSKFSIDNEAQFGLVQRDQDFANYQDFEAEYHKRPSVWVILKEAPAGDIVLFEYNTPDETQDNVVSYFELNTPPSSAETPIRFGYELYFGEVPSTGLAEVQATRTGLSPWKEGVSEIIIDFMGEPLDQLDEVADMRFVPTYSENGILEEVIVKKNPYDATWRVILHLIRLDEGPIELSGYLENEGTRISETWSYQWIN